RARFRHHQAVRPRGRAGGAAADGEVARADRVAPHAATRTSDTTARSVKEAFLFRTGSGATAAVRSAGGSHVKIDLRHLREPLSWPAARGLRGVCGRAAVAAAGWAAGDHAR